MTMRTTPPFLTGVAAALLVAPGLAPAREQFNGVTSVVAEAVSGALERRVDEPEQVGLIVQEVNAIRRKNWSSYQGKFQACAVRLTFHSPRGKVGTLVLQGDELLEPGPNRTSGYKRELTTFEAPTTRRLAARIRKPSECKG
jgi:hypothetical protein